jgi:hypothetical protein
LELIEAADGPLDTPPLTEGLPQETICQLSTALQGVTNTARRQLAEIKVASLAARRKR